MLLLPTARLRHTATFAAALIATTAFAQDPHPEDSPARLESALLWTQTSGEWRALCYQAWNVARDRLDGLLAQPRTQPPAVIVDIDETVLDNSPYHARLVLADPANPPKWADWINRAEAKPIPGALEFLRYAVEKKVTVFYVTNRTLAEEKATLANLRRFDFPSVDLEHVIVRSRESSKERRRAAIAEKYDILLLCGDNLGDFAEFGGKNVAERNAMTDVQREEFGRRFIVFPNAFVGDWVSALYRGTDMRAPGVKREDVRRKHLQPMTVE